MQEYVIIANTVWMTFLFIIWSRDTLFNLAIKIIMLILAIANGFWALKFFGYIVKI